MPRPFTDTVIRFRPSRSRSCTPSIGNLLLQRCRWLHASSQLLRAGIWDLWNSRGPVTRRAGLRLRTVVLGVHPVDALVEPRAQGADLGGPRTLDHLHVSLIHISEPTRLGMISY